MIEYKVYYILMEYDLYSIKNYYVNQTYGKSKENKNCTFESAYLP